MIIDYLPNEEAAADLSNAKDYHCDHGLLELIVGLICIWVHVSRTYSVYDHWRECARIEGNTDARPKHLRHEPSHPVRNLQEGQ